MHRFVNTLTVLLLTVCWWRACASYRVLPARIPIHFNLLGRPDGWGARWMIWFLPTLALGIACFWLSGFTGFGLSSASTQQQLPNSLLLMCIVGGFVFINQRIIDCAKGESDGLSRAFLPIFLMLIMGLSAWISRVGTSR
ncbi:MAG: DUF1648 domain-containing protein [Acidobacteria bacterium]|nr:DUF1648 domain-containing protein [Acidobacteriota bacterium]